MKLRLLAIGERMPAWVADGFAEYRKRLSHELPLELVEIGTRVRGEPSKLRDAEGAALLAAARDAHVVALDGRGEPWSSEMLAKQVSAWKIGGRDVALLIGGADGHPDAVLKRADQCWSLGPLTLPHMLVRLVVAEQLYRATTILSNHPYHRG